MIRILSLVILFSLSQAAKAQSVDQTVAVKKVITIFFEGLHQGDSSLVAKTMHQTAKIQTTFSNKTGKHLKTETRENLLTNISKKRPTDVYLEKLLSYDIKIDGNLASVWTPYEFYLNGNFSHCGANSFQLFNDNGNWQIIYLVDMRRRGSCEALKDKK